MSDHRLMLTEFAQGAPHFELVCLHHPRPNRPDPWVVGEEPCWLQTWWGEYEVELVHILTMPQGLGVDVEAIGWRIGDPELPDKVGTIGLPPPSEWQVYADHWNDELRPSCTATSCREAAQMILRRIEWDEIIEELAEWNDMDPLVCRGLAAMLDDRCKDRPFNVKDWNSLHAWATSHMRQVTWCATVEHHDDEGRLWFGGCDYPSDNDGAEPHEWVKGWMLDADPKDFIDYATHLFRRNK